MQSKFDDNFFSYEADLIQNYEKQLNNRNKEISKSDEEFPEIKERTEIIQAVYYSPKERKASNDTLSINGSQAETLSQTSESSFFISFTNSNKSLMNSSKENIQIENKQNVNIPYYFGMEEYYQKLMPEKFIEYKNTKNYLPKYSKAIKNEDSLNSYDQSKSKEMSQKQMQSQYPNYFPFPYYGIFYQVNPLMFNHFPKAFISNQNKNKNKKIIKKNSDDVKPIKEENQENKTEDKKDEQKDIKNEEKNDKIEKNVQKQQKLYSKNTNKAQHISNKNNYKRNTDKEYYNQRNSNYNNYNGQYKNNYRKNYNYKYNYYDYIK